VIDHVDCNHYTVYGLDTAESLVLAGTSTEIRIGDSNYYYYHHHPHHHHHHHPHSLLHSSFASSQNSTILTDQALLIHCCTTNYLTMRHVLRITGICIRTYGGGRKLRSFKLLCNLYGILPHRCVQY